MANLPLAFAELLAGGILATAGATGDAVGDVMQGTLTTKPFAGASGASSGATASTASANPTNLPSGVGTFDGKPVAKWIIPILQYARAHGWTGSVTSGYRSFAEQQRIYNSGVRPAAVPGTSNHEGSTFPAGAVDVSNASQLSSILRGSPYASLLQWAGSKDPVHFSHPHGGSY